MTDLPVLTTAAACKAHVRSFLAPRGCKECGCRERYLRTWNVGDVACVGCESLGKLSLAQINATEKRHNEKVQKSRKKNWTIPTVYGGMSTISR